jgi:hypothetical protein
MGEGWILDRMPGISRNLSYYYLSGSCVVSYLVTYKANLNPKTLDFVGYASVMLSTHLLSFIDRPFLVILADSYFAFFLGSHVSEEQLTALSRFVATGYNVCSPLDFTFMSLDSFVAFCVSPGPGRPCHFYVLLQDRSIVLLDILPCHSSVDSFVGSTFLLSRHIITDGYSFGRKLSLPSSDTNVSIAKLFERRFSDPCFHYTPEEKLSFTDCRDVVLLGTLNRVLTGFDFSYTAILPDYFTSFTAIYTASCFTTRWSMLAFHGFIFSFIKSSRIKFLSSPDYSSKNYLYDHWIAISMFCAIILSDKLHHSFLFTSGIKKNRKSILALTSLVYSLFCSVYARVTEEEFSDFLRYLSARRPYIVDPIRSMFSSVAGRNWFPISGQDHTFNLWFKLVVQKSTTTTPTVVRPHTKRFVANVASGLAGGFGVSFQEALNSSITGCVGFRLSCFCLFAQRASPSSPYCYFNNKGNIWRTPLPFADASVSFYRGRKDGDVYYTSFQFFRFVILCGFYDLVVFLSSFISGNFN